MYAKMVALAVQRREARVVAPSLINGFVRGARGSRRRKCLFANSVEARATVLSAASQYSVL